jgi:hypothetical protein
VWSYERPAAEQEFVRFLGDAKKLDNGNVLIVWSSIGEIAEVTPDGDVVWQIETPDCCFGRGQLVASLYDLAPPIQPWR